MKSFLVSVVVVMASISLGQQFKVDPLLIHIGGYCTEGNGLILDKNDTCFLLFAYRPDSTIGIRSVTAAVMHDWKSNQGPGKEEGKRLKWEKSGLIIKASSKPNANRTEYNSNYLRLYNQLRGQFVVLELPFRYNLSGTYFDHNTMGSPILRKKTWLYTQIRLKIDFVFTNNLGFYREVSMPVLYPSRP